LLTQSLESPSGLGRYWPVAKELGRLGHEVTLLALHHDYRSLEERRFRREGVAVHYVGQMHVRKAGSGKFYYRPLRLLWVVALASLRLAWAALRVPTDVYHIGKPHPMNGLAAWVLHLLGKPVCLDCDDYEAASNRFSGRWQRRGVAFFEDRLPRIASAITVNTRFTAERLRSLGYPRERIVYVPNGVDRERFAGVRDADAAALRQRLDLVGRRVVLYVGSMSLVNHAVDLLLEAFALVREEEPEAVLLLVGGGEDLEGLCSRAESLGLGALAQFVGRVEPAEVPLYYALADVSVDPVRDDLAARARSPLKVVESLVTGVPVVTGDIGDRRECLGDGAAGELVEPGDADALAEGILRVLRAPESGREMRQAAERLREGCYWDVLVRDFAQAYAGQGRGA
jgi:glycosyltransferase involved in cell wall biosynthesis